MLVIISQMHADRREMLDLRRQLRGYPRARQFTRLRVILDGADIGIEIAAARVIVGGLECVGAADRTTLSIVGRE